MADKPTSTTTVEPVALTPEMSLEEAGSHIRQGLNFYRGLVKMNQAVEAALTAKQQLAQLEKQKADVQAAIDDAMKVKAQAAQDIVDIQQGLAEARSGLTAAQADLKAINATIADTRKAWVAEQVARDKVQQDALAILDAEIVAKQRELADMKAKVAEYVSSFQQSQQA